MLYWSKTTMEDLKPSLSSALVVPPLVVQCFCVCGVGVLLEIESFLGVGLSRSVEGEKNYVCPILSSELFERVCCTLSFITDIFCNVVQEGSPVEGYRIVARIGS